jgi:hypothetical protein
MIYIRILLVICGIVVIFIALFAPSPQRELERIEREINENIDTGKATLENQVSFVQGGQEVFRVSDFSCPHCGTNIKLIPDYVGGQK